MGRGDNIDDIYGGLYSPSQSLTLASQRAQTLDNPLTASPGSTIQPTTAAAPTAAVPNPLIQPAFPLSTMSPERQLLWQDTTQKAQKAQSDLDAAAIAQEITRREEAHKVEMIRQSREMINRSTELDPGDLKNYPLARAKLARDFPIGAGTAEVERALKPLDEIHKQALGYENWYQKEFEKTGQTEAQKRLDDARKQVAEQGPDAIADFALTQQREGTEAAIQKVNQGAAAIEQANIIAQLQNAGLTEDQIKQKYTDPATGKFLFPAAKAEAKVRVNPTLDYNRAVASYSQQLKARKDAGYDGTPNADWSDQQEQIFQGTAAYVNQTGARAGIQNFDPAKVKADAEAKAKADADAAEAKARAGAATAAKPSYFGHLLNAALNIPDQPAVSVPPPGVPGAPSPTPTPAPSATPAATPITKTKTYFDPKTKTTTTINWRYVNGKWEKS